MPAETLPLSQFESITKPEKRLETSLTDMNNIEQTNLIGWQEAKDCLQEWWRHGIPELDVELVPPTHEVLEKAFKIADDIAKRAFKNDPPSRVLPNGEGGIVFERFQNEAGVQYHVTIEISKDLAVKKTVFKNSKLIREETF